MSAYYLLAIVFGLLLFVVMALVRKIANSTYIKHIPPGESSTQSEKEKREEAKKWKLRRVYAVFGVYFFLCILSFGWVAARPTLARVGDALNPSATPTVTFTRTITPTPRNTNTPRPTITAGGTSMLNDILTPKVTGTSTPVPATQTPRVISNVVVHTQVVKQNVPVTVIVQQTVVVVHTVLVPVTVTNTPTYPPPPPTYTFTPSPTSTFTETATATATPSPTFTATPTGTP